VLQLLERAYPQNDEYANCTASEASALAGTAINSHALHFDKGGWLNPSALCRVLVTDSHINVQLNTFMRAIEKAGSGWTLSLNVNGDSIKHHCQILVLANGANINAFAQTAALPIVAARGQTSRFGLLNKTELKKVVTGKRYVIPDNKDLIVGALNNLLPDCLVTGRAKSGFCATRATTPDRLPILGPVPAFDQYRADYALLKNGLPENRFPVASYQDDLYVIGGFGSRGLIIYSMVVKLML